MKFRGDQEWMIEHLIFHELCARYRRTDVEQVYIAVQSAIAFGAKKVDVGVALAAIRPAGFRGIGRSYPAVEATGLAFFKWLYDVELVEEGDTDYHIFRFTRRHDRVKILVDSKRLESQSRRRAWKDMLRNWRKSQRLVKRF